MVGTIRVFALCAVACATVSSSVHAQRLALKTVPIATGDQFFFVPTRGVGMGGLAAAIRDTLADPWSNPAAGGRLDGLTLFAAPTGYTISDDIGAGFTLAAGGLGRSGDWFGGITFAIQQLENPNANPFFFDVGQREGFIDDALGNDYVQLFAGRRLNDRTAIGASFYHAGLSAVEGVSQLYAGNAGLHQEGDLTDWRAGLTHELSNGSTLEAVVVHSRFNMLHEVRTIEWIFQTQLGRPTPMTSFEENLDRTRTTGFQVGWQTPLADTTATFGLALTANRKSHPKIPNYRVANIPRDPGNSTAFALSAGLSRQNGPSTVGMEVVWNPARSHTWAEAEAPTPVPGGGVIPTGGRTVENWFRFSNLAAITGYERDNGGFAFRFGIGATFYRYRLKQTRWVEQTTRRSRESWFEWSPAWGITARPQGLAIHYTGRLTAKGFPDIFGGRDFAIADSPGLGSGVDFLPAVTQPVRLDDFATWTHQLAITVPIGGKR